MNTRTLIFDASLCTGCRACELACSFKCEGEFKPSVSRIQVVKNDENGVDVPIGCEHCDDGPCAAVCPVRALRRDETTGAIVHEPNMCIRCRQCLTACPFAAMHYDSTRRMLYKCDLCKGDPECVKWCFTGAVKATDNIEKYMRKKLLTRAETVTAALRESSSMTIK